MVGYDSTLISLLENSRQCCHYINKQALLVWSHYKNHHVMQHKTGQWMKLRLHNMEVDQVTALTPRG